VVKGISLLTSRVSINLWRWSRTITLGSILRRYSKRSSNDIEFNFAEFE
jgi:hypothetical protein